MATLGIIFARKKKLLEVKGPFGGNVEWFISHDMYFHLNRLAVWVQITFVVAMNLLETAVNIHHHHQDFGLFEKSCDFHQGFPMRESNYQYGSH